MVLSNAVVTGVSGGIGRGYALEVLSTLSLVWHAIIIIILHIVSQTGSKRGDYEPFRGKVTKCGS
jgi:NAD(P)-dependent dehydrogenase (short-subunit alcohol dehydrogenase family)